MRNKKRTWFKLDTKIFLEVPLKECNHIVQAAFINLCCMYWNKDCQLTSEEAIDEVGTLSLTSLENIRVIEWYKEKVTIPFLDEQWKTLQALRKTRQEAVQVRWDNQKKEALNE